MRVLILQPSAMPGQMLAPGVVVDVDDATAARLIEAGAAQAVDMPKAVTSNPVLDGMVDVPPAPPRRRAKAEG